MSVMGSAGFAKKAFVACVALENRVQATAMYFSLEGAAVSRLAVGTTSSTLIFENLCCMGVRTAVAGRHLQRACCAVASRTAHRHVVHTGASQFPVTCNFFHSSLQVRSFFWRPHCA